MTLHTTSDAHRRIREALLALCREGALAVRLERAHAALAGIDPARDLPETVRFRFEELLADITYGADTVGEALAAMDATDREHLAGRVVSLFDDALRSLPADV